MYHGKYAQTRVRDSTTAQWWLTAGCCGLVVTTAFVAFTLWLGMEGSRKAEPTSADFGYNRPPPVYRLPEDHRNVVRPSRGKVEKVHKDEEEKEEKKPTHLKLPIPQTPVVIHSDEEEERTYQGTLDRGEELLRETGVKDSNIKKKSEAVYPSGYDPDFYLPPRVFNPVDIRREETSNDFTHYAKPEIPPFTYIKDPAVSVEERIDSAVNNYFSYPETSNEGNSVTESSLVGFLRKRLVDVKDWLIARGDQNTNTEWVQLISAINQSIAQRNLTTIMSKLREMYNSTDVADVPVSSILYPDSQNGSSLLSFGLLAVDLFLLHNVQQIAWTEEAQLGDRMLDDPEVVAMNALFLSPDRAKQLRQKGSRVFRVESDKSALTEALEFVNSMLRAILNLNKAYRSSAAAGRSRGAGPSTMDCIWTLYCRNLDKTAKLQGPYGFLAKMNR